jgi:hypothetical protein
MSRLGTRIPAVEVMTVVRDESSITSVIAGERSRGVPFLPRPGAYQEPVSGAAEVRGGR